MASPQAEEVVCRLSTAGDSKPESPNGQPQVPSGPPAAAQPDIDPDYQELNEETEEEQKEATEETKEKEDEEESTSPRSDRERADSDQFASYEVPETGLQVEIQTALLSSPIHSGNAGTDVPE